MRSHRPSGLALPLCTLGLGCLLATACGADAAESNEGGPLVLGLSRTQLSVGQSVEIIGGGFMNGSAGHTEIRLDGEYHTKNGPVHPVSMQLRPHWEDGNRLIWSQVGPFTIPFSPTGDELGTFQGTVTALNIEDDGDVVESEPADVSLEILPSVIIRKLQPVEASSQCQAPSRVILGGFSYKAEVEAIGFEPVNFSYVVFGEPGVEAPRIIRRQASGTADAYGEDGDLFFTMVPEDMPFYVGTFAVASLGTDGIERVISLSYGVHNAIEHVSLRKVQIGEIETAVPVSGCFSGGDTQGRTLTYSEQEQDTRSRTVGVTWNESFQESASSMTGGSTSETYGINYSIAQSETSGWEMGYASTRGFETGGNASVSLFGAVEVGASGKYMNNVTNSRGIYGSSTRGYTVGRDYSVTDTESWAFTQTRGYEVSQGGQDFWTISSSETTIMQFQGMILPGEFGVFYRQATRLALPGAIVAYDLCGAPNVVAETQFQDYTWSVDLAQGEECPPMPETDLPETECFQTPCISAL